MRRLAPFAIIAGLILAACTDGKPAPPATVTAVAEVEVPGQPPLVTHGDDRLPPKPVGLVAQLPPQAPWPCEGDGTDGRRVQAVYAHPAGAPGLSSVRPAIEAAARQVEGVFLTSAQATGGSRRVRFVTDANCTLSILDVPLTTAQASTFDGTIGALVTVGLNRPDRIYHSWVDAGVYCGIGTVAVGDQPVNVGDSRTQYSRSDKACWSYAEAHEIVHNLGGVQLSAPNSSGAWHCNDEADLMCYADGGATSVMRQVCTDGTGEDRIDCNNDDFYSTNPPSGSYLATHWNVANSAALSGAVVTTLPPSSTSSTVPPSTTSSTIGTLSTKTDLSVPGSVRSGVAFTATAKVTGSCGPTGTVEFYVSGVRLTIQTLTAGTATATITITGGASRPTVRADYMGSATCARSSDTARPRLK